MNERTDPKSARRRRALPGPAVVPVLALLAVGVPAYFELGLAAPWRAEVYLAYGVFWALVLGVITYLRYDWPGVVLDLVLTLVCLVLLAVLYLVPWNSRKVFLEDLWAVKPGMSVPEMEGIMGKYIRGSGWPANPLGSGGSAGGGQLTPSRPGLESRVYRHSTDGRFNSDWGVVYIKEGKVVGTEFFPD